MKAVVFCCIKSLGRTISFFWSYSTSQQYKIILAKLYTSWISSELKTCGHSATINYPINLAGGKYITIGSRVAIGKYGILTAWDHYKSERYTPVITIGDNTSIGEECHVTAINCISIGKNVLMGKKITITDNTHGTLDIDQMNLAPIERTLYSKGPVIIEDNVWIGDKATILANVRIGKNAIIGAHALVTKDVPANCVVGGVPAKVIKQIE